MAFSENSCDLEAQEEEEALMMHTEEEGGGGGSNCILLMPTTQQEPPFIIIAQELIYQEALDKLPICHTRKRLISSPTTCPTSAFE